MKVKNNKYQKMKTEQRRKDKHSGTNKNSRDNPPTFTKKEYEEFRKKNGLPMFTSSKIAKKKSQSNKAISKTDNKVLFQENDDYGESQEISFDADLFNATSSKKTKHTFNQVNGTVNYLKSKQTSYSPVNNKDTSVDISQSSIDVESKDSRKKNKENKNTEKYNKLNSQENRAGISKEKKINTKENELILNKKAKKRKLEKKLHLLKSNDSKHQIDDTETLINSTGNKRSKSSLEPEMEPTVDKLQQRIMQRFQQSLTSDKNIKYDKIRSNKQEIKTKVDKPNKTMVKKQDETRNKSVQNKRIIFDGESENYPRNEIGHNNGAIMKNKRIIFENDDATSTSNNKVDSDISQPVLSVVKPPKQSKKKDKLKKLLVNIVKPANDTGSKLRQRMMERLKAAQFRYLNEKLYTSTGSEAQVLFRTDPDAFTTYHEGYKQQVTKWPMNPLDVIVNKILKMPKTHVIADMGCGEAALSSRVPHTVHSLDLVACAPHVTACDMARTPLPAQCAHVAVYCLSLMGTQLTQYLKEANRVLKPGGRLMIAEVESRFEDVNAFTKSVERLGFRLQTLDQKHQVFFFLDFTKTGEAPVKVNKLPEITLKPCLYKRR